jgi:hypothetical protein
MFFKEIREIKNTNMYNNRKAMNRGYNPDARVKPSNNNPTTNQYDVDKRVVVK